MTCWPLQAGTVLLSAALLAGCNQAPRPKPHVTAPAGPWVSLFDGKDLNGWVVKIAGHELNDNFADTFHVENGILKVSYNQYERFDNQFGAIYNKRKLSGHWWVRVEYRFSDSHKAPGAPPWTFKNSGIYLYSQPPETIRKDQQFPVAVEFDLVGGHMLGGRPTGDVCQNATRVQVAGAALQSQCSKLSDVTIRDDQWTIAEAEISANGSVRQMVNGDLIVEYNGLQLDDGSPDARKLLADGAEKTLSSGYLGLQSNGYPIEFRRVEVLELGPR